MSAENQNHSDPQDYARALEVMRDVSEQTVKDLGQETVAAAENITHQTGELEPKRTVIDAETITRIYGSMLPSHIVDEAGKFTAYDVEVTRTGEDLPADEREAADGWASDEAEHILMQDFDKRLALGIKHSKEAAHQYELSKAMTAEERNKIIERHDREKKGGDDQPPKEQ
jgi:hypothetical protein